MEEETESPYLQNQNEITSKKEEDDNEDDDEEQKESERSQWFLKFIKSLVFMGQSEDDELNQKLCPHWFIHIGYFLCFLFSITSLLFVMLYGFAFGKVTSDKWVLAMLVSLLISVFVFQPTKVSARMN